MKKTIFIVVLLLSLGSYAGESFVAKDPNLKGEPDKPIISGNENSNETGIVSEKGSSTGTGPTTSKPDH